MQKLQNNRKQRAARLEQVLTPPSQRSTARWQADVEEPAEGAPQADVNEALPCSMVRTTVARQPATVITREPVVLEEDEDDGGIELETGFEPREPEGETEQEQEKHAAKTTRASTLTEGAEPAPILLVASQMGARQTRSSMTRTTSPVPVARGVPRQTQGHVRTAERPTCTARLPRLSRLSRRPVASPAGPSLWQRINAYCQRQHWSTLVLATIGVVVCLLFLSRLCLLAWTGVHDQLNYGMPRTMQLDKVVGDHDSAAHPTHVIALNLHGQIELFVLPGGDATHAQVLIGPRLLWANADAATVTVEAHDLNHDGKLDLVVQITGAPQLFGDAPTMELVAYATNDGFKPLVQVEQ